MKKTRMEKGITLVALIITIVVLLILAVVAINAITDTDLIAKANSATTLYNNSVANEQVMLQNYLDKLDESLSGGGSAGSGSGTGVTAVTPTVGQYVEYDISYTDIYDTTKTYGKTNGWRYLGTESGTGNHLLISTGIPTEIYFQVDGSVHWSDAISESDYTVTGKAYSDSIQVRTLTLEELNRAVNSANGNTAREETSTESGWQNLTGEAEGLLDIDYDIALDTYEGDYVLANAAEDYYPDHKGSYLIISNTWANGDHFIHWDTERNVGVRPVIVLPSTVQFTDADTNSILEIN